MAIKNFDELIAKVKGTGKKTVALVGATDDHALEAVIHAKDIVNSVLIGDPDAIVAKLKEHGEDPTHYEIEPVEEGVHPAVTAANLIHAGRADFIMKGKIMSGDLLHGVLLKEANLRVEGQLMSHIIMAELPGYHKLLCVTDGGMVLYPDLEKKIQIVTNAVNFFHRLGYERPNVAALCVAETVNPKQPETVHGAELKRMSLAGELPNCYVEGPISYDLAMVPEISEVKGFECPCAGDFDILLVPEVVCGNALGKAFVYTCGGRMAGIVLGCKVPIVLTSRGSSTDEKYYSLALGAGVC